MKIRSSSTAATWLALLSLICAPAVVGATRDENGIPNIDDPIVQKHLAARGNWIADENTERQDFAFRQALSPVAQQAEAIVAAIRQDEINNYWRHHAPVGEEDTERFAGMMFPKARPFIVASKLWNIVRRMPKGSLLHSHWNAMVSADVIINCALGTPGMVISASQNLSTDLGRRNATIAITHMNTTVNGSLPSLSSPEYVPNTRISLTVAADSFPGGRDAFISFLKTKMTLLPEISVRHDLGVDAVWHLFRGYFSTTGGFLAYEPVFRTFLQSLLKSLVDDEINWVELRSDVSIASLIPHGQAAPSSQAGFPWQIMLEEIEKFKASPSGKDFWGLRVIWSDRRAQNRSVITTSMRNLLKLKQQFPHLFSGYDFVGQEDIGRPLADLAPELLWFREQTELLNVTLPFFLHAGETLGTGNSTDLNLFDAMLFSDNRRIGHGFSLYKHPALMRHVRENKLMVEVCPISNEVLRLATDVLHHPLPALIANGVPTCISNDDPSIMGQDGPGLSFDFYQTLQGFESLGLGGLGALAENSVRWSNFEDQTHEQWLTDIQLGMNGTGIKARRLREWHQRWEDFCAWIVDEYGDSYGSTP